MLEFNTAEEIKSNTELLEIIKDFIYTINKVKYLLKTNKKGLYQELQIKDK